MQNKGLVIGVVLLVAAAAGFQWWHTRGPAPGPATLQATADKINLGMPRPYVNGLVQERARVVGKKLVIDIYIPDIRIEQLDPDKIPVIGKQEQGDLVEAACADPDLRSVLRQGLRVGRRFMDMQHTLIFELDVGESDCRTPQVVG